MGDDRGLKEKDFFLQATLRMFSSLDLNIALSRCQDFVKDYVPFDGMMLTWYDLDTHVMHINASTTKDPKKKPNDHVAFPKEFWKDFKRFLDKAEKICVLNDPDKEPSWHRKASALFWPYDISLIRMVLEIEGQNIGAFIAYAEGKNRFSNEHIHLISMLHEPFAIALCNAMKHYEILRFQEMLLDDNKFLFQQLLTMKRDDTIIGADSGLKEVMQMVQQVAPLDSLVLLLGETGVGKEVVANALHQSSRRRNGPFIKVNCGAIPENLIDSELFGHERGAFTDAVTQKRGLFERADKGTIFLDEIGELSHSAQVRLLRVIQSGEIHRVGGTEPIPVDVRIICATHRDLRQRISSGQFREDLWFRINVFPIEIPPLRERKGDIPALIHHFINRKAIKLRIANPPHLDPSALDNLMEYQWPGNIRELENTVERALIRSRGESPVETLNFHNLGSSNAGICRKDMLEGKAMISSHQEAEKAHIRRAIELAGGKVQGQGGAAQILKMHPSTLRSKMRKLGIPNVRKGKFARA
jgi:transcriptional regulator with GAF, ATPase, and Fis domain